MKKLPRVIIYQRSLLPYSETFIKAQALALREWQPVLAGEQRVPGLSLDELEVQILHPSSPASRLVIFFHKLLARPYAPALALLRSLDARLLHAHFGTSAVDIWPYAKSLQLPLVVTLHGYDISVHRDWWESGQGGFRRRRYPKQLLRLAQQPSVHFVAVSEAIREKAIKFGIPAKKISVCYTGVDATKFFPAGAPICERDNRILFVGRLVEKKGAECLIQAFSEIQRTVPDAQLIIVGEGPLRDKLQALATSPAIQFLGVQSAEQIRAQLNLARVVCLPSIIAANGDAEGFPTVLPEAQLCGVPVVTSAEGGATEGIIEGVTGFRFAPGNVTELAEKVIRILDDDNLAAMMAEQSAQIQGARFAIETCIKDLERVYADAVAGAG